MGEEAKFYEYYFFSREIHIISRPVAKKIFKIKYSAYNMQNLYEHFFL